MSTTIRLPDELVEAIDELRGDVPRERWVRRVLGEHIEAFRNVYPPTDDKKDTE